LGYINWPRRLFCVSNRYPYVAQRGGSATQEFIYLLYIYIYIIILNDYDYDADACAW
jgi:hypothetical protein